MLRARILGAAAGGGLPQWNCGCENCRLARAGQIPSLTQSSLAVSGNGRDWAILNASPDIRSQLAATPELHPTGPRDVPLVSVLLTNGDIDHVAGLLCSARAPALRALRHRRDPCGPRGEPDLLRRGVRSGAAGERRHGACGDAGRRAGGRTVRGAGQGAALYGRRRGADRSRGRTDRGRASARRHATTCSISPAAPW